MKQPLVLILIIALCLVSTNQRKRKRGDKDDPKKTLTWGYANLYEGNSGNTKQGGNSYFGVGNYDKQKEIKAYCCDKEKRKITFSGLDTMVRDNCYGKNFVVIYDPKECEPEEEEEVEEIIPPKKPEPFEEEPPKKTEKIEDYNANYKWARDRFLLHRAPTHVPVEGYGIEGSKSNANIDYNVHGTWKKNNKKK